MIILHCTLQSNWEKEAPSGSFGNNTIASEGQIKCFNPKDVNSDNFSFPTMMNYIILGINTDVLEQDSVSYLDNCISISKPIDTNSIVSVFPYTFDQDDKFVKSPELVDIEIANEVLEALKVPFTSLKYFKDGTSSRIFLLNGIYIVKQNDKKLLKSEVEFAQIYADAPIFQKLAYFSSDYRYIVYHFAKGDVMHAVYDVDDFIISIKNITKSYKSCDKPFFGYVYSPYESWIDFLKTNVHEESLTFPDSFEFLSQVYDAINKLQEYSFEPKLLHGDFGSYNFIRNNGKISAVIDPIPTIGDPLYDFLHACLSNIDVVKHLTIDNLTEITGEPIEKVKAMLTVKLFCRISVCLRHHKEDFDSYVDFWHDILN